MEFCASMLWTACNVMVSTRYANDSKKFTASIMSLSLASTTGMIIAKIVGGALLSQYHWRQVCLLSAAVGVFGSVMLYFFGINEMSYSKSTSRNNNNKAQEAGSINQLNRQDTDDTSGLTLKSIKSSISNVLGNRMFYAIACAHFGSFIIRSSDKVMGTFIADATLLPSKYVECFPFSLLCSLFPSKLTFKIYYRISMWFSYNFDYPWVCGRIDHRPRYRRH